jgi:hypothetical protein
LTDASSTLNAPRDAAIFLSSASNSSAAGKFSPENFLDARNAYEMRPFMRLIESAPRVSRDAASCAFGDRRQRRNHAAMGKNPPQKIFLDFLVESASERPDSDRNRPNRPIGTIRTRHSDSSRDGRLGR